jgi:regulator of nonsense transcripts 3
MASVSEPRQPISIARHGEDPARLVGVTGENNKNAGTAPLEPSAGQDPRMPSPKLKVVVRRLPPGLTEAEYHGVMGEEWKLQGGRVDWLSYRPGKVSKE